MLLVRVYRKRMLSRKYGKLSVNGRINISEKCTRSHLQPKPNLFSSRSVCDGLNAENGPLGTIRISLEVWLQGRSHQIWTFPAV